MVLFEWLIWNNSPYTNIWRCFEKIRTLSLGFASRGIKEVIRMSDEAIRELFRIFVEEGELDEEQAERIIQRILKVLRSGSTESEDR